MLSKSIRSLPILVLSLLLTSATRAPAWAEADYGPGTDAVRKANEAIRNLLGEKVAEGSEAEKALARQVTRRVRGFLDVAELGRRALQDHLATLSERQLRQFTTLLRRLIEQSYIKGLRANLQYEVEYLGERIEDQSLEVKTRITTTRKGRPYTIRVDYLLRKDGNRWRAYDIVTDGVGLVENYRAQFNRIIAKEGFGGLLKRMQQRCRQSQ